MVKSLLIESGVFLCHNLVGKRVKIHLKMLKSLLIESGVFLCHNPVFGSQFQIQISKNKLLSFSRIQQIQILLAANTSHEHKQKVWSQVSYL